MLARVDVKRYVGLGRQKGRLLLVHHLLMQLLLPLLLTVAASTGITC